jgi:TFIIF-interacting CTD phosphatase-like protein
VFTAGLKEYANYVLDDFDKGRLITRRFYRDSCTFKKGIYMKDITKVNKDLAKVVIIDNISENF